MCHCPGAGKGCRRRGAAVFCRARRIWVRFGRGGDLVGFTRHVPGRVSGADTSRRNYEFGGLSFGLILTMHPDMDRPKLKFLSSSPVQLRSKYRLYWAVCTHTMSAVQAENARGLNSVSVSSTGCKDQEHIGKLVKIWKEVLGIFVAPLRFNTTVESSAEQVNWRRL
jgi:hypothetical protein